MGITRRDLLKTSAGVAAGLAGAGLLHGGLPAAAQQPDLKFEPEKGADCGLRRCLV